MPKSKFLKEIGIASTPDPTGGFQDVDQHYEIGNREWEILHALSVLLGTLEFYANDCHLLQITLCPEIEHGTYTAREDMGAAFVLMGACPATIASMTECQKRRFLVDAVKSVLVNEYGSNNRQLLASFEEIVEKHWPEKLLRFAVLQKATKTYAIEISLNYSWQEDDERSYILTYSDEKRGLKKSAQVQLRSFLHLEHLLGSVVRSKGQIVIKPKMSGYDLFRKTQLYEIPLSIRIDDMTDEEAGNRQITKP